MIKRGANEAFATKVDFLRRACLEANRPTFFPTSLSAFADWEDVSQNIKRFSRPILYRSENQHLLAETKSLIQVSLERWRPRDRTRLAQVNELEALVKLLTSRYQVERQLRLDAEQEAEVLRDAVDSLSSKVRDLTGRAPVRLVSASSRKDGDHAKDVHHED